MKTLRRRLTAFSALAVSVCPGTGLAFAGPAPATNPSCIAMMMPTVQGVPGNAPEVAGGVRDLVANYLTAPSVKAVALEARLPSLAVDEAREKGCESLLYLTLTWKSGTDKLTKTLGQAAGTSPGGQVQFGPKSESQTATVDGEDLLTPVAMRAAEAIVTRKGVQ